MEKNRGRNLSRVAYIGAGSFTVISPPCVKVNILLAYIYLRGDVEKVSVRVPRA